MLVSPPEISAIDALWCTSAPPLAVVSTEALCWTCASPARTMPISPCRTSAPSASACGAFPFSSMMLLSLVILRSFPQLGRDYASGRKGAACPPAR